LSVMGNSTHLSTTTPVVVRDWNFVTTSHSPIWGVGAQAEIALSPNLAITVDVLFDKLRYTKVANVYWGTDDANTTTDERTHMVFNEDTRARLWDMPVLAHYRAFRSGALSRLYLAGGAAVRAVSNIKTNNTITYPNSDTKSDVIAATPSRRNLVG